MKLTRRFSQGVSLTTNYTWSKSIDNASGLRTQGYDTLFPQDSTCLACEQGLSSFDVRHRWVLGAVYDLPIGKGRALGINNSVGNAVIGGWQLSGSMTVQSGVPQTLTVGFNNAGTNNPLPDRPSYTGADSGYLSNHTHTTLGVPWYNPSSFAPAPQGSFGNVGRSSMITPAFQTFDLALHKQIAMPYAEGHSLQLRLEAFNVFNHPVWSAPQGNTSAADFGIISATSANVPMRQLQLGVKYSF